MKRFGVPEFALFTVDMAVWCWIAATVIHI